MLSGPSEELPWHEFFLPGIAQSYWTLSCLVKYLLPSANGKGMEVVRDKDSSVDKVIGE